SAFQLSANLSKKIFEPLSIVIIWKIESIMGFMLIHRIMNKFSLGDGFNIRRIRYNEIKHAFNILKSIRLDQLNLRGKTSSVCVYLGNFECLLTNISAHSRFAYSMT